MTEHQKGAYRYLLYWAMLDFRNKCQPRARESRNPLVWWRQYRQSRAAGAVADWLHNLALRAAGEFSSFDEQHFWLEFEGMSRKYSDIDFSHYRSTYDRRLAELQAGQVSVLTIDTKGDDLRDLVMPRKLRIEHERI